MPQFGTYRKKSLNVSFNKYLDRKWGSQKWEHVEGHQRCNGEGRPWAVEAHSFQFSSFSGWGPLPQWGLPGLAAHLFGPRVRGGQGCGVRPPHHWLQRGSVTAPSGVLFWALLRKGVFISSANPQLCPPAGTVASHHTSGVTAGQIIHRHHFLWLILCNPGPDGTPESSSSSLSKSRFLI